MSRTDYNKLTNAVKAKLSDIIINFNFVELSLRDILSDYIKSTRTDFVNDILLSNSILSFSAKFTLFKYIVNKESIEFNREDSEKFHTIMSIRNAVAHSDNLLNFVGDIIGEEISDDEFGIRMPIYMPYFDGPKITVFKNGKVDEEGLDTKHQKFIDIINYLKPKLEQIKLQLAEKQ